MLEVLGQQPGEAVGREVDLLEQERLARGDAQPLEVQDRRTDGHLEGFGDPLAGGLVTALDDLGLWVEAVSLHLLGEAQSAAEVDLDRRLDDERATATGALEPPFSRQLGESPGGR